jgi:hypothetical protein
MSLVWWFFDWVDFQVGLVCLYVWAEVSLVVRTAVVIDSCVSKQKKKKKTTIH